VQKKADLPKLGLVQSGVEGRHAAEANAVFHDPMRFAHFICFLDLSLHTLIQNCFPTWSSTLRAK
jgi:hypothetical protein